MDFAHAYYHHEPRRMQLNRLVLDVFGLDFAPWNALKPGIRCYTPFTFFHDGRAVANVSASPMELTLAGREVAAVQVGTVCTRPEHRGKGLVRELMTRAHTHWHGRRELSFLFANETVLDFYQQLGYRRVEQHRFHCAAPRWRPASERPRTLDILDAGDRELMRQYADERAPVSDRVGVRAQAWLWLFHARMQYAEHLRYIEPLDLVAVSRQEQSTLHIFDLVGRQIPSLAELYPYLGSEEIREVRFHFTPDKLSVPRLIETVAVDAHLFVRGAWAPLPAPFGFPVTGEA